jgi:Spy/CpxP family protein refolding chaperone
MRKSYWIIALLIAFPTVVSSQTNHSPYAGEEARQVKSLTEGELRAYLEGRGMGLAKPAELNSYPGPMHVLELAEQLQLSDTQKSQTEMAFRQMRNRAIELGKLIVRREGELNQLFSDKRVNSANLQSKVEQIAKIQGELRMVHLRAHLEMKRVLSPEQIKKYDELRGYGSKEASPQHKHEK